MKYEFGESIFAGTKVLCLLFAEMRKILKIPSYVASHVDLVDITMGQNDEARERNLSIKAKLVDKAADKQIFVGGTLIMIRSTCDTWENGVISGYLSFHTEERSFASVTFLAPA